MTRRFTGTPFGFQRLRTLMRARSSSARVGLALALALGLGACADAPTGTIEAPAGASRSLAVATPSDAQAVAEGLALAMRDPSIRRQVHRAMRASRFKEHKLVVQDLVNTPDGESLVSAATKSAIANLPALDFYLPFETQRQTWRPTADVYVAVTFDPDAPTITAYGTNGQTLTLRKDDGVPAVPLIILHPAEPKATRSDLLRNSDEDLIESPAGNKSVSLAPSGASFVMPIDDGGGGGGGGTTTAPGTYITHFNIKVDDGWFGGSEMVFYSSAIAGHWLFVESRNGGTYALHADYLCDKGAYGQNGVVTSEGYDGLFLISPTVTTGSFLTCEGHPATYAIHIMESDGGLLFGDDDFGWRIYGPGGYPAGAMRDFVYSYYKETYPAFDYNRSAYLRISTF